MIVTYLSSGAGRVRLGRQVDARVDVVLLRTALGLGGIKSHGGSERVGTLASRAGAVRVHSRRATGLRHVVDIGVSG